MKIGVNLTPPPPGYVSISAFASLVGIFIGIGSYAVGLNFFWNNCSN